MRWTRSDQRSLPDGTSTWVVIKIIPEICKVFIGKMFPEADGTRGTVKSINCRCVTAVIHIFNQLFFPKVSLKALLGRVYRAVSVSIFGRCIVYLKSSVRESLYLYYSKNVYPL